MATLPPPDCVSPVTVSGVAVLASGMAPEVLLLALKVPTVLAPPRVVPPAELVNKVPVVLSVPPTSLMMPLAVRLIVPPSALTPPVRVRAPVLLIVIPPPPGWMIPVTVKGAAVLVSEMAPPVVFVALKLAIALAPPSVVPPAEVVINDALVLTNPLPLSLIVPAAVSATPELTALTAWVRVRSPEVVVVRRIRPSLVVTPVAPANGPEAVTVPTVRLVPVLLNLKSEAAKPTDPARVPTALAWSSVTGPPAAMTPSAPAVIVPLEFCDTAPAELRRTVPVPAAMAWVRDRLPLVVVANVMSALLVVTPVVAPTVPIVNARLSLRNAKLLPAPVTFAAKVPIWLASSIDTGPTAVMLSVLAMTGGVSLMPAPAISCRVRPAISIVAARLMFDPESSFTRLLTLVGP